MADDTTEMSSELETRSAIEPRATPRNPVGLRRQSVYIAALVLAVVVLGGLSIAAQRQRNAPPPVVETPMIFGKPDMAQTTSMAKLPANYAGFDPAPPVIVNAAPGRVGGSAAPTTPAQDTSEVERLRLVLAQAQLDRQNQQRDRALAEYETAMNSPLLFKGAPLVRPGDRTGPIAIVTGEGPPGATTNAMPNPAPPPRGIGANAQDAKSRFLSEAASVEPYLRKPLIGVQSAYEVKAGGFIPAALVTAIDSDLPGEVIAQVSQNVYDTVSGDYLLIPQGTRVLGKYQSLVSNGQNRALIVWTRLVMPNGDSIVLEGMSGADQTGAAGAQDEVDYNLDKLAAAATLSTALAYGGNLAREGGRDRDDLDVVGETIAQESSKIGGRIIDRQLDVQPTIKVRQGHPINVVVNKDMVLKPYVEN